MARSSKARGGKILSDRDPSPVGPSGLVMVAQGALIVVRDLLEDIPVVGTGLRAAFDVVAAERQVRAQQLLKNLEGRVDRLEELIAEPEKAELLFRGIRLSLDARTADTIDALAAAVAYGLKADSTGLALAHMTLDAIGSLDETQIHVLQVIATPPPGSLQVGGFSAGSIGSRLPDLDPRLLNSILALLQGKGLVSISQPDTGLNLSKEVWYYVTPLGEAVHDLLSMSTRAGKTIDT